MKTLWIGIATATLAIGPLRAQQPPPIPSVSRDTFDLWFKQVSNTGRWGPGDERGTLNLITTAARAAAARTVRSGHVVSLANELVPGPNPRTGGIVSLGFGRQVADSVTWGFDTTRVSYHGWGYTHMDALAHTSWRGRAYNDVSIESFSPTGATRLGIQEMHTGVVARAVLFDIPRLRGLPYLEPGTAISAADLDQWARDKGIRVQPGDVILIRTGRWARDAAIGPWRLPRGAAGPHPSVALWLHAAGAAALGGDGTNEYYPSVVAGLSDPLHQLTLTAMGLPLLDNLDLEALAAHAAQERRWTFFFIAAPLRIRGGSGSLINPLAIF
jgi:kynurenine formamidase